MYKALLAIGVAATLASGAAIAQVKPEILVKQRQAVMTLQGKYFGPMAGMAQGKIPFNKDVIQRNAGYLDNLSRMAWDGFADSTKDVRALPCRRCTRTAPSSRRPPAASRTRRTSSTR